MATLPVCGRAWGNGHLSAATSPFVAGAARRIHGSRVDSGRVCRPEVGVFCGLVVWVWVSWLRALLDFIRAAHRTGAGRLDDPLRRAWAAGNVRSVGGPGYPDGSDAGCTRRCPGRSSRGRLEWWRVAEGSRLHWISVESHWLYGRCFGRPATSRRADWNLWPWFHRCPYRGYAGDACRRGGASI